MIKKRRKFFIKENFQLQFILCCVLIIMAGVVGTILFIFCSAEKILEEVVFSSHLDLKTSVELFGEMIVRANIQMALMTFFLCVLIIAYRFAFLKFYFYSFIKGLNHLANGNFSFRLKERIWLGDQWLSKDFNALANKMDRRSREVESLLKQAINVVDSPITDKGKKLADIHHRLRSPELRSGQ
ncbi:MAG: hypothetical protein NUV91_02315 [Candidatus Omnitrophica bacterium]|nr:hypothetical protein [Candidatus Omnitrophota bacterium]